MKLNDAEQLAKRLMIEFGLGSWIFRWSNAKRTFGTCSKSRRTITLSADLVERNDQAKVEDTIRHEIAHALASDKAGHNGEWKRMCAITGAKPIRCYGHDVEQEAGDWRATCGGCGHVFTKFRKPKQGDRWCCVKECVRKLGSRHPLQLLRFRHKNEVFNPTKYAKSVLGIAELKGAIPPASGQQYRSALDLMKEQLRKQEEMQQMKDRIAELERKLGK